MTEWIASRAGAAWRMGVGLPGAAVRSILPSSVPLLSRPSYRLELLATFFFAIAIAPIEGGIISVFTKRTFADEVPAWELNLFVAFLGATPEIANVLSFVWGAASQGKAKIPFINALQAIVLVAVALLALAPQSTLGLWLLTALVLVARVAWSGILTVRPTVWRANYGRGARARIVGKLQTVQVATAAAVGVGLGAVLDAAPGSYRWVVPLCAGVGLLALLSYAKVRVRREAAMLRGEAATPVMKPWKGPRVVWDVLRQDRLWAKFQISMFILGFGNIMMLPILVITLKEQFNLGYLNSILITTAIPSLIMPLAIPVWARLLDRAHVVRFRSIHSWSFVAANAVMLLGAATARVEFFFAAAVLMGVGYGGGSLAWNLGHVDFAPPADTSRYMASHVTLNGIRGLIAPFFAVGLHTLFGQAAWAAELGLRPTTLVMAVSCVINVAGAVGFVLLRREMGDLARAARRS